MQVFVNVLGKNDLYSVGLKHPTMTSITIKLADGQEFRIKDGEGKLRISVNGRLAIEPQASNVIQVKEVD
ncbi:hypothetical protein LCGC14_2964110 [marine sediment metagenome]|uniref:Uncharacterized protein n=1 Tax=marine sediment metagenome TaxID=412755 RepID=A0A0F9A2M3_9ZZZZ